MEERITLKIIAKEFNVSIATVSKALRNSNDISTSTKKKIQKYAELHNYRPNSLALGLLNKKTKTIGVIIPNIMNNFFTKVFVGIEEKVTENGYSLISCISNESYEKEKKTIDLLNNGTLDGFIISLAEETQVKGKYDHLKSILNSGLPIVLFDRVAEEINCDKVIVNDYTGAYEATEHLIKTGCKKIALISTIGSLSVGKLRTKGYIKALEDHKIEVSDKLIVELSKRDDFDVNMKILLSDKSIDALLCLEESSALKSLEIVRKMNYEIPEEMSIICFTNGRIPQYISPSITTISQHGKFIGETAAQILIDRLESKEKSKENYTTKMIKTSLIHRESTKNIK